MLASRDRCRGEVGKLASKRMGHLECHVGTRSKNADWPERVAETGTVESRDSIRWGEDRLFWSE